MKRILTAMLCACSLALFVGTGCKKEEPTPAQSLTNAVESTTEAAKDAAAAAEKDATKVGEDLKKAAE